MQSLIRLQLQIILVLMKPQLQKKGLFTFYPDEGEDQIALYLTNKQSSLQQTFTKQYVSSKLYKQKQQKAKPEQKGEQIYRQKNRFSGITELLEKNRVRRNHNLLKIFLKKSQKVESSSEQLKNRLQQLLKDQSPQRDNRSKHESPQQLSASPIKLSQNLSIGRMKSKQKLLLINVPKRVSKNLKNMVYSKVMGDLKEKDKLPKIEKGSLSAALSISIPQVYDDTKQRYSQPMKSGRKYQKNHYLDLDHFNRKYSLQHKDSMDALSQRQKKLLQKFCQSIKFK